VPASHAVEPVVGEDAPAVNTTTVPAREREPASTDSGAAPRRGRATRGVHGILSPADRASFRRLAASLGGTSGLAVSAAGRGQRVERAGTLENAIAWSTAKVPIAMAVIAAGAGSAQQANLQGAIAASDNAAALRLWSSLGGGQAAAGAADEQLRAGGDPRTRIEARSLRGPGYTPFGQTAWALSDQTRFTAGLPCTDPGARVLGLMDEVVAGQRWGLGSAGVQAQFKGGWGPGSQPGAGGGYLDRQMGILTIHGRPLAVAIATEPVDGSHATGIRNLTAIARWIVSHVDTAGLPGGPAHC
jgi:beta-lactamase class A